MVNAARLLSLTAGFTLECATLFGLGVFPRRSLTSSPPPHPLALRMLPRLCSH